MRKGEDRNVLSFTHTLAVVLCFLVRLSFSGQTLLFLIIDIGKRRMQRVVVTGMGIVSSIGDNVQEVRVSLKEGRSGITFSPEMAELGFRSQVHGKPKLDPFTVIDRRIARFMGQGSAWNYIAMEEAIADARLSPEQVSNERTGLIMGSGGPSVVAIVRADRLLHEHRSTKKIGPFEVPKAMSSTASATLATPFKIKGVNHSITAACATSAICIGSAYEQILMGKQDVVFAGGSEELTPSLSCLFDAMGAMSSKYNATPSVASRAYDKDRDGFVIAGGAGVLVLESLEHAQARNAPIIAEMVGYGHTSDGHDMVAPSGEGAERCMRMALGDIPYRMVNYINPHGTSTPVGDGIELQAIERIFGHDMPAISSTKSLTGHSLGATGVQEAIYSLISLQDHFLPESAHIHELDPEFAHVPIVRKTREAYPEVVLSNSFGFGGTNATLAFRSFDA
jgi:3-oxoacyl-[acyl-carrier-protein] synthase-1